MTVSTLLELADRAERATGPDRELDVAIATSIGLDIGRSKGAPNDSRAPTVTASLDAAMTLPPWEALEEWGYLFALEQESDGRWTARFDQRGDECGHGDTILATAATKENAVVAASLRSREAIEQGGGH